MPPPPAFWQPISPIPSTPIPRPISARYGGPLPPPSLSCSPHPPSALPLLPRNRNQRFLSTSTAVPLDPALFPPLLRSPYLPFALPPCSSTPTPSLTCEGSQCSQPHHSNPTPFLPHSLFPPVPPARPRHSNLLSPSTPILLHPPEFPSLLAPVALPCSPYPLPPPSPSSTPPFLGPSTPIPLHPSKPQPSSLPSQPSDLRTYPLPPFCPFRAPQAHLQGAQMLPPHRHW